MRRNIFLLVYWIRLKKAGSLADFAVFLFEVFPGGAVECLGNLRVAPTESEVGRPPTLSPPWSTAGLGQRGEEQRRAETQSLVWR